MADERRTVRFNVDLDQELLALVRQAAARQGQRLGEFVVAAAQEAAHRTIDETHLIRLSAGDQARFVSLLLDPPGRSPAMERARAAHDLLARKP